MFAVVDTAGMAWSSGIPRYTDENDGIDIESIGSLQPWPSPYKRRPSLPRRSPRRTKRSPSGHSRVGDTCEGAIGQNGGRNVSSSPNPYRRDQHYSHDDKRDRLDVNAVFLRDVGHDEGADSDDHGSSGTRPGAFSSRSECSPMSSRSRNASPSKNPWYPPARRDPPGKTRTVHFGKSIAPDGAYVVHPTFTHMFSEEETDRRSSRYRKGERSDRHREGDLGVSPRRSAKRAEPGASLDNLRNIPDVGGVEDPSHRNKVTSTLHTRSTSDAKRLNHLDTAMTHPQQPSHAWRDPGGSDSRDDRGNVQETPGPSSAESWRPSRTMRRQDRNLEADRVRTSGEHHLDPRRATSSRHGSHSRAIASNIFAGHTGQVLALAFHEGVLFSAAADGTAKAWDPHHKACLATYNGHREAIWGMQATGRTLVTGSADRTVRFWDIETAKSLHVIDLDYPVRDVVVVGELLAIAMSCPDVEVIDLNSLTRRDALRGHLLAVSALASLGDGQRLVSGSHDTFLRIWNVNTGSCDAVLGGHSGTIGALHVMPPRHLSNDLIGKGRGDEETHSNNSPLIVSGSGDATARVWRRGGREEGDEWACLAVLEGHAHGVWTVHGRADTGIIATGGGDATVKVWIPSALTLVPAARGSPSTLRNPKPSTDATRECRRDGVEGVHHSQEVKWESVGGVRGTIGAVGAVLMTEETLLFGTSEALIADFPLHSCMPLCP